MTIPAPSQSGKHRRSAAPKFNANWIFLITRRPFDVVASYADELGKASCVRAFPEKTGTAPPHTEAKDVGETSVTDRVQLLEAALDSRSDGIAVLGGQGALVFWNRAAEAMTGYQGGELLSRPLPPPLEPLAPGHALDSNPASDPASPARAVVVEVRHKLGHSVRALVQRAALCDPHGEPIGSAVSFHPSEALDALSHEEAAEAQVEEFERDSADLEERLQAAYEDCIRGGLPFGVLLIGVDQTRMLCKTHGVAACRAMLDKVRRSLAHGLKPADQMIRWGEEYLVIAHERSSKALALHAQSLAAHARTADFRWWGDRVSITVSAGAAQAANSGEETLPQMLDRARQAMESSHQAGGNRAMLAPRRPVCSQS